MARLGNEYKSGGLNNVCFTVDTGLSVIQFLDYVAVNFGSNFGLRNPSCQESAVSPYRPVTSPDVLDTHKENAPLVVGFIKTFTFFGELAEPLTPCKN